MNDFNERSFSKKTYEIDEKLVIIMRINEINLF